ncbi:MAG TPA: TIGR01458 family HAD-type hydrolase [Geobacteraceae bacterium]|nr:TIGR01458 family HAD-type hydrolase [Geobacteraceae bacterium]
MIKGILIDLSGTVHVGDQVIPGATEAIRLLQRKGMPFRFVTNTSRETRGMLHQEVTNFGLDVPVEHVFTAPLAVRRYLEEQRLRPFLLIHPNLAPDFADLPQDDPNVVVVGFAKHAFTYEAMNRAFRLLKQGAPLLAVGRTRYYQAEDGLDLDAGPFVAALEYAAETEALVLGKPSRQFFLAAVKELGCRPEEAVMVGDDAISDAGGALEAGLSAILVQTGKYRPGDEEKIGHPGVMVEKDVGAALERILAGNITIGR